MFHAPRTAVAVALMSLFLTGSTLIPEAERRTATQITGTWNAVAGERLGKDYTAVLQKRQWQWEFEGNNIKVRYHGEVRVGYTYKIDATKTPAQLDLRLTTPGGNEIPAIYKLEGKRLFICMPVGVTEKQRPTEFKSTTQPRTILFIFERASRP